MKKKQSQIPSPKKTQSGKQTDFPLPQPMELAKLAAILRPSTHNPTDALKVATEWYFEAVLFARDHASSQIKTLLEQKKRDEKRAKAIKNLKELQAASSGDVVGLGEAWCLLANPRKLAERLNKLPKEGEPLPQPGQIRIKQLHELPAFSPKTDRALKDNIMKGVAYALRTNFGLRKKITGVSIMSDAPSFEEMFPTGKIATMQLEWVLRYRYDREKEKKRKAWKAPKKRQ